MAFYLVRGRLNQALAAELKGRLDRGEIAAMRPFGPTMTRSLAGARLDPATGEAVWEEECYCRPPLAQERAAVLDRYFDGIRTETVSSGEGWRQIDGLPRLWPEPADEA